MWESSFPGLLLLQVLETAPGQLVVAQLRLQFLELRILGSKDRRFL